MSDVTVTNEDDALKAAELAASMAAANEAGRAGAEAEQAKVDAQEAQGTADAAIAVSADASATAQQASAQASQASAEVAGIDARIDTKLEALVDVLLSKAQPTPAATVETPKEPDTPPKSVKTKSEGKGFGARWRSK
jgi:MoxR-like ATPase